MKKVTSQEIFQVAAELAAQEKMPTIASVQVALGGRGSVVTIHKYLKQWKKRCLALASTTQKHGPKDPRESTACMDQQGRLEALLENQATQHKMVVAEFIRSEKEVIDLKNENNALQEALKALDQKNREVVLKSEHLEKLCESIQAERRAMAEAIAQNQQKYIESLQQELREVNQYALAKLKTMGYEGDEALMAEKVRVIHLEDKLKSLESDLKKQKAMNQNLIQGLHLKKEGQDLSQKADL